MNGVTIVWIMHDKMTPAFTESYIHRVFQLFFQKRQKHTTLGIPKITREREKKTEEQKEKVDVSIALCSKDSSLLVFFKKLKIKNAFN